MTTKIIFRIAVISLIVCLVSLGGLFIQKQQLFGLGGGQTRGRLYFKAGNQATVSRPYEVVIMADSGTVNINAVGIYLRFDPEKLAVSEIDTLNSFCQFYPEKKFDNNQGLISLACGSPHPGISGEAEILRIVFVPRISGTSRLFIDQNSSLLSSDGKGTNILNDYPSWEVAAHASL